VELTIASEGEQMLMIVLRNKSNNRFRIYQHLSNYKDQLKEVDYGETGID